MISVLNGDWEGLSVDLTGPDGTEIIGRLVFLNCPVCNSVVAPATEDKDFAIEHAKRHIKEAQDWDHVNRLLDLLTKDAQQQVSEASQEG